MELAGNIKDFSVIEICQFIWISKRTGKLELFLEQGLRKYEGSVFFVNGSANASTGDGQKGKDAFFYICEAENGSFRFIGDETSPETNIYLTMDQLLLEASGRIKLYETLKREIPSTNIVYALSEEFSTFELVFDTRQWSVIGATDGEQTIGEISKELGFPEFDTLRIFYSLLQVGVIKRIAIKPKYVTTTKTPVKSNKSLIEKIIDYIKKL